MKNSITYFVAFLFLTSMTTIKVWSHTIEGTLVLKGALKTKNVTGSKKDCLIKIDEVKNLLLEDSFGNPAYKVYVSIMLGTSRKKVWLNNLFDNGNNQSIVKDFEYHSSKEDVFMTINSQGRILNVKLKSGREFITCHFNH